MKRDVLLPFGTALFLAGIVLGMEGNAAGSGSCRVLELIRMNHPNEFTCRVDRWWGIDDLRLRVTVRDLSIPEDQSLAERMEKRIEDILNGSPAVRLENVHSRNYFRVIADVQIDHADLVETLQKEGLAPPVKKIPEKPAEGLPAETLSQSAYPVNRVYPKEVRQPAEKPAVRPPYSRQGLENILNAEVDLTGLDSNTSLKEALEVIRLSFHPPLPMVVLWNDLIQNLYIDPETPIGVGGLGRIPLKLALELILSSVSPGRGRPVVLQEDTLLLIVSSQFAQRMLRPRVYDIGELANIPVFADEPGIGGGTNSYSNSGSSGR